MPEDGLTLISETFLFLLCSLRGSLASTPDLKLELQALLDSNMVSRRAAKCRDVGVD